MRHVEQFTAVADEIEQHRPSGAAPAYVPHLRLGEDRGAMLERVGAQVDMLGDSSGRLPRLQT